MGAHQIQGTIRDAPPEITYRVLASTDDRYIFHFPRETVNIGMIHSISDIVKVSLSIQDIAGDLSQFMDDYSMLLHGLPGDLPGTHVFFDHLISSLHYPQRKSSRSQAAYRDIREDRFHIVLGVCLCAVLFRDPHVVKPYVPVCINAGPHRSVRGARCHPGRIRRHKDLGDISWEVLSLHSAEDSEHFCLSEGRGPALMPVDNPLISF